MPGAIKLNDKRSYKQESQGKRAILREARIDAAREGAKASRRALPVALPMDVVLPSLPAGSATAAIACEAVAAVAGGRTVFSGVTLEVGRDRVALCGPNGAGKTTLLEIALGLRRPAAGRVFCDALRVGYIAQNADNWCVEDCLVERLSPHLQPASPAAMAHVLRAHRFPFALAARPPSTLSPGERVRAALICLTRQRPTPDLLVLDEPTQHLDFGGLQALEAVLAAWPGGLLVVSHDGEFLDAIGVSRSLELAPPGLSLSPAPRR